MASQGSPADDLVYDLVSIQYHAMKASQVYDRFLEDAAGNDEVVSFLEQVQREDAERARRCHELLVGLTQDGIG